MATFNPTTDYGQPDNFTGRSGGFGPAPSPNRALGSLFEGVGNIAADAANAADTTIKQHIYEDARGATDEARSLFGVEDATDVRTAETLGVLPPEITQSTSRLEALTKGYANGTIRPSHYEGILQSMVRGLRAKYPGYDREIDNIVQEVTGITPANALLNSIRQEALDDAQVSSDSARNQREFIEQHAGDWLRTNPGGDPFSVPFEDFQRDVFRIQAQDSQTAQDIRELNLNEGVYTRDHRALTQGARAIATRIGSQASSSVLNTHISEGIGTLGDMVDKLRDGGITPNEEMQIEARNLANKLMTDIESSVRTTLDQKPPNSSGLTPWEQLTQEERREVVTAAQEPVKNLMDALLNEDYGLASYAKDYIELHQNNSQAQILDKYDVIGTFSILQDMLGPTWSERALQTPGPNGTFPILDNLNNQVVSALGIQVAAGQSPGSPNDVIQDLSSTPGIQAKAVEALIESNTNFLSDLDVRPQEASNIINWLFGEDNGINVMLFGDANNSGATHAQRARVFATLTSPKVTERVVQLAQSNPQLWETYRSWAYTQFSESTRGAAATVNSTLNNFPYPNTKLFDIAFNATTGRIEAVPRNPLLVAYEIRDQLLQDPARAANDPQDPTILRQGLNSVAETVRAAQTPVIESLSAINLSLSTMKPIFEQEQEDAGNIVNLLKTLGIPIEQINSTGGEGQNPQRTSDALDDNPLGMEGGFQLASYRNLGFPESDFNVSYNTGDIQITDETAGKIRDQPVQPVVLQGIRQAALATDPGVGITIVSGGQDAPGEGGRRTGSRRHDHGGAADIVLTRNGVKVTPTEDPELYARFIENAAAAGFTGMGHYAWGIHVGGGTPAFWGPDTRSASADPRFLEAYERGRSRSSTRMASR